MIPAATRMSVMAKAVATVNRRFLIAGPFKNCGGIMKPALVSCLPLQTPYILPGVVLKERNIPRDYYMVVVKQETARRVK